MVSAPPRVLSRDTGQKQEAQTQDPARPSYSLAPLKDAGNRRRSSEVPLKDLKEDFKEAALAGASPQIFKCFALLKYLEAADLPGIPLCVASWSRPQEKLPHPGTFKRPS